MIEQVNGQGHGFSTASDSEELSVAALKEIPLRDNNSQSVFERVAADGSLPFEQKSHDLMIRSVDKVAQEWIAELVTLRENSKVIEQMLIEQATKVKNELTKLHLLGAQAMREAQRGHEVLQHLAEELDSMMAEKAAA